MLLKSAIFYAIIRLFTPFFAAGLLIRATFSPLAG
jgi:hypothetical protein